MILKQKQAFTLVELIVVITILAILGTIAFISLQGYSKNARDSTRISDVASMRKTLELYKLKNSKVPLPDNGVEVLYDNELLRTQGFFGENVAKGLGKLLSKAPLDPLTNINYIYSVESTEKEYEILMILEGNDLVNSKLGNKANADSGFTPKIKGNYNGIFVQSENYIIPTPSIINAEINESTTELTLDGTNIKSQVVNGQDNIPKVGNEVISGTGKILGMDLLVHTGSIETRDDKIDVVNMIQSIYELTELVESEKIKYLLSAQSKSEQEVMYHFLTENGKELINTAETKCENGYIYNSSRKKCESTPICELESVYSNILNKCEKTEITPLEYTCSVQSTSRGGSSIKSCSITSAHYCNLGTINSISGFYHKPVVSFNVETCQMTNVQVYKKSKTTYYYGIDFQCGLNVSPGGEGICGSYGFKNTSNQNCPTGYVSSGAECTKETLIDPTCLNNGVLNTDLNICQLDDI